MIPIIDTRAASAVARRLGGPMSEAHAGPDTPHHPKAKGVQRRTLLSTRVEALSGCLSLAESATQQGAWEGEPPCEPSRGDSIEPLCGSDGARPCWRAAHSKGFLLR
jgi:hypothetical protein